MAQKRTFGDVYRPDSVDDRKAHKRSISELKALTLEGDVQCAAIVHYRAKSGDKRHPLRHGYRNINVCSGGTEPYKRLSPMLLGPVHFSERDKTGAVRPYVAQNVENLWQFAKVWDEDVVPHGDPLGRIKESWFALRDAGWADTKAHRRPRGKVNRAGPNRNVPLFSYWNGQRYPYGEARLRIYIPYYVQLVEQTEAYAQLKALIATGTNVQIVGYDGRDVTSDGVTLREALDDHTRPFGHELVLMALLRDERVWEQ